MKLLFLGTPEIAVPSFLALQQAGHEIALTITQPDRPKGRGKTVSPCAVKQAALDNNIPVLTPTKLKDPDLAKTISDLDIDVAVVMAYGRILPQTLLDLPKHGMINIHTSLLPKYRGPSPIFTAIRNGDKQTGITIMKIVAELDAGPILSQFILDLDGKESTASLEVILAELGAEEITKTLAVLHSGTLPEQPQDESLISFCHLLEKSDGKIDWSLPAAELDRHVRACDPWPVAYTTLLLDTGDSSRMNIFRIEPSNTVTAGSTPLGTIVMADRQQLCVQCGDGVVSIKELQPAGKKRMKVSDFLRGRKINMGSRFE